MASLQGTKIKDTYKSLLKVADNGEIEITGQEITDGAGNGTGVSLNNSGDVTATGTVSFNSLKDSGEDITITKFVDEADGIANNDNDSSIPTSAAVRDYVDNNITAQDLDISDGTNAGSVDLDSQSLIFTGDAGVSATVSGQTVTFDSSVLQSNIDAEASVRLATDNTLQSEIDTEITNRISADAAQAAALTTEETARLAGDAALQAEIDAEAVTRAAEDTNLHAEIDAETSARAAADVTLQSNIDAETAARTAADTTLQNNITAEASTRAAADTTLQSNIDSEAATRAAADTALQAQITSNDSDISGLDTRLTTAEGNIASNDTDIAALDGRLTTAESNITSNDGDIAGLDTRLTTAETNISSNDTDIAALDTRLTTAEVNITSNDSDIAGLDTRLTTAEGDITALQSGKQDISEKGQPNGYTPLDSGAKIDTIYLPDSIVGQLQYEGTWDAATNTPTLADPTTVKGHYYVVSVEGTYLGILYHVGDWIVSNGTIWEKVDNTDAVTSVFGRLGAIVANESDYSSFYPLLADFNAVDSQVTTNTAKLATIETGADVTDATNVAAAGALMSGTAVLDDLADVSVASPLGGQVLTYNATSGQWESASAGSAPVTSVNTQTGDVVLDADNIDDSLTTNKFTTAADISKLAGIEAGADVTDAANVTTALGSISVTAHSDVTSAGSGAIITSAERTKLNGIEAGADVTDTANVVAALTAGTNITIGVDGTISSTDTNTTYTAGTGLSLAGTVFSHSDTSAAATLTASGRTYVTGLTFDTFGHVTGYTTGTETVVDTNTTYSAGSGIDLVGTTFSHSDTSSAANLAASGRRYVTGLTFDTYGHVTGYTTGTETVVDTNTTYSAGAGLDLVGTTFSVESDLRGEVWLIGRDNNDYIHVNTTTIDFVLDGNVDARLYNNGDFHADGNIIGYSTSISDQKFKDDVTPIESALDKVKALKGVEYTWNATSKKGKRDLGFIAQEVEQIIPEIVTEHTLSTGEFADNPTQSKTIDYEKITAVLVEAVKEQQKQIDELKAKLDGITN